MSNGTCPSCGKNTTDTANADHTKVLVGIQSGQRLPAVCHACGVPTRTTKRLSVESEPQDTTFATSGFGALIVYLFKPLRYIDALERHKKTIVLSLLLPTCKQCARTQRRIEPNYIDFDAHRIDLVVHLEFKRALEQSVLA